MLECLKFMMCVNTIPIDCLPIEQHIMSRKHYANAPLLAYRVFVSWSINLRHFISKTTRPSPSWITWSRPCGIQCMDVSQTDITYRPTSYSAFIQQDTIRWPPPSIIIHFLCLQRCCCLLLIPNYRADNGQGNVKRYTQRSFTYILMLHM